MNQQVALGFLRQAGHQVAIAQTGREAVTLSEQSSFDVLLMDCQMPEMDGFEATGAIRAREILTRLHLPIVAMTALAMKGDRELCLAAGMDLYISKPIDPAELSQVLNGDLVRTHAAARLPAAIDLAIARRRLPAGENHLQKIAGLLLEESAKLLAQIQGAIASRDATVLRRSAHTLRGSTDLFGASALSDVAQQLEEFGRHARFDDAARLLPRLEAETLRLQSALKGVIQGGSTGPNLSTV